MEKREKVLIVLMVISVIIGGANYGIPLLLPERKQSSVDMDKENSQTLASSMQLAKNELSKREMYVLAHYKDAWNQNPFIDKTALETQVIEKGKNADGSQLSMSAKDLKLEYLGYLKVGDKIFAFINNQEYTLGERIDQTEYILLSVKTDEVIIQSIATDDTINIPRSLSNDKKP